MSARPLRVGIVGVGFGARVHQPAFRAIPGVEVAALCDSGSGRSQRAAREAGVAGAFNDWREMIASAIDIVSVATPPSFHREIVTAALRAGKHVLCEKPLGTSLADALSMETTARETGLVHAVGFEFRLEPGIQELCRLVAKGALGALRRIQVSWLTDGRADREKPWSWQHDSEAGGGVLEAFGSHMVDYIGWIADRSWLRLQARSEILIGERRNAQGERRKVTAEDTFDLIGELEGGVSVNLTASNCQPFGCGHRIEFYGNRGRAIFTHALPFSHPARLELETEEGGLRTLALPSAVTSEGADSRLGSFREMVGRFIAAVRGESAPDIADFSDGVAARAVLDAARESVRTRAEVQLLSPGSASQPRER